jgi:hypothetical protein
LQKTVIRVKIRANLLFFIDYDVEQPDNSISKSKVTRRRGEDSTGSTASHADKVSFDLEME